VSVIIAVAKVPSVGNYLYLK